jgi:hypothetical protein
MPDRKIASSGDRQVPNHKHQISNKFQTANSQITNETAGLLLKSPRLEFAVLPFGPCLDLGACDLELLCGPAGQDNSKID